MIRPARPYDAGAVADVWLRSFAAALPSVRRAHSDDEVRGWVRDVLLPAHDVWVAEAQRTDGSGNEEREPDVRYVWRPGGG